MVWCNTLLQSTDILANIAAAAVVVCEISAKTLLLLLLLAGFKW
jgi:hypothetical protein